MIPNHVLLLTQSILFCAWMNDLDHSKQFSDRKKTNQMYTWENYHVKNVDISY